MTVNHYLLIMNRYRKIILSINYRHAVIRVQYANVGLILIHVYMTKRLMEDEIIIKDLDQKIKILGGLSIFLWVVTITAGRFLAYTNSVLLASRFY